MANCGALTSPTFARRRQSFQPWPAAPKSDEGGNREMEARQAASRLRLEELFQSLLHRAFSGEL
jgi:hypothetical protein